MSGQATAVAVGRSARTFPEIFDEELAYVLRTLRYLGVRDCDAEDVAHDVFLHVHRHFEEYDSERPVRPWLFAFAYRSARDHRARRSNRLLANSDLTEIVDPAAGPESLLLRSELQQLALSAMLALDDDERAVFVAHEIDELAAPELASALQIPVNTAYSRLRRARAKFAAAAQRLKQKDKSP